MASVNQVECPGCRREYLRTTKQINQVIKRSGSWRCRSCATAERNARNARQIGDTRLHKQTGYIEEKTHYGWRRQHIAVMERAIGRRLRRDEVVHHINEVKTDNRIENLRLMTQGEHSTLHNLGAKFSAETRLKISLANRKFDARQVQLVRSLASAGISQKSAALLAGMSQMAASRILRGITYREIE